MTHKHTCPICLKKVHIHRAKRQKTLRRKIYKKTLERPILLVQQKHDINFNLLKALKAQIALKSNAQYVLYARNMSKTM